MHLHDWFREGGMIFFRPKAPRGSIEAAFAQTCEMVTPCQDHTSNTVDGRNPPPKKPWNDDSLVNTNKQWFPHGFQVVRSGFCPSTVGKLALQPFAL